MHDESHAAMNMALEFLRGNATVTVDGLISTAGKIRDFISGLPDEAAAEAPKATRRKKADTVEAGGAASEPSTPSEEQKPTLVSAETAKDEGGSTTIPPKDDAPAEPTQEDKDQLLKEATQFSQKHGHDALLAALKAVGAERFSAIAFDKYPAFREAMAKTDGAASALS